MILKLPEVGWHGKVEITLWLSVLSLKMISIYDAKAEQMQIEPYEWIPFPTAEFWLQQPDHRILQVQQIAQHKQFNVLM